MLRVTAQTFFTSNPEGPILTQVFNPEELEVIKQDLNSPNLYLPFGCLEGIVTTEFARDTFRGTSFFGLATCVERLNTFAPAGFSRVFVNWVPRPNSIPMKSEGGPRDRRFEVVTEPTDYKIGGSICGYDHCNGVLTPALPGDVLRIDNMTRVRKRPVVSTLNGEGRRFRLWFMK